MFILFINNGGKNLLWRKKNCHINNYLKPCLFLPFPEYIHLGLGFCRDDEKCRMQVNSYRTSETAPHIHSPSSLYYYCCDPWQLLFEILPGPCSDFCLPIRLTPRGTHVTFDTDRYPCPSMRPTSEAARDQL